MSSVISSSTRSGWCEFQAAIHRYTNSSTHSVVTVSAAVVVSAISHLQLLVVGHSRPLGEPCASVAGRRRRERPADLDGGSRWLGGKQRAGGAHASGDEAARA